MKYCINVRGCVFLQKDEIPKIWLYCCHFLKDETVTGKPCFGRALQQI
jgi:hypothetical protein